jgi:hypothetical protein
MTSKVVTSTGTITPNNYYYQIDRVVKANKLYRFESEVNETKDEARKQILNKLIKELQDHKDSKQIKDDKMKAHLNLLKISQYQKKWQFLNVDQRLNRLDEFFERKGFIDETLKQQLRNSIKNGEIPTKCIKYDKIKYQIESIENFPTENGKNELQVAANVDANVDANVEADVDNDDKSKTVPKLENKKEKKKENTNNIKIIKQRTKKDTKK